MVPVSAILEAQSDVVRVTMSVAIMLLCGFAMTRLTKLLKLPNVTAYIVTGILLGPYCLRVIPQSIVDGMDFLPDVALSFIAFSAGEYFELSTLRKNGKKVVIVTLFESVTAAALILFLTYGILHLDLAFAVVLSALATATAPASTIMTILQTRAKGEFVDILLQVVALDDAVGLIAYSTAIAVAVASISGKTFSAAAVLTPVLYNAVAAMAGILFGGILKRLMTDSRTRDNRLIIAISLLFVYCGACALLDISPLLGCMVIGAVYINRTGDHKLFKQLSRFSPPVLLLFFVRSGLVFDLSLLMRPSAGAGATPLLTVGILYFVIRIAGKYIGAYAGCRIAGTSVKTRNYLGLALIPQAGVAIGLAALGARTLGGGTGKALETIILSSSVLYELIGPGCAKLALSLSGSFRDGGSSQAHGK